MTAASLAGAALALALTSGISPIVPPLLEPPHTSQRDSYEVVWLWSWPTPPVGLSHFGERPCPDPEREALGTCKTSHGGLDMAPADGTIVRAAGAGTVVDRGSGGDWGNWVKIDHGDGVATLYAHMKNRTVTVSVGDAVERGQPLGIVGDTGWATGVHLHFEVHVNGARVDPWRWMHAHSAQPYPG